jgi:predicted GIY-YIG superfamily endonuclease
MVEIEGTAYPVLQVLDEAFGTAQAGVCSDRAARILGRLGFPVSKRRVKATRRRPKVTSPRARTRPLWRRERLRQDLITQPVEIPVIVLHWSYPWRWEEIAGAREDSRDVDLPPEAPGVYDVRAKGRYETLYIGQTTDLMRRVYHALVKGILPHVAGEKIRENENLADLSVRWAYTDRPAAVEEELHRLHIETFGYPPTYAGRR